MHITLTECICMHQPPLLIFMSDGVVFDSESGVQEMKNLCDKFENKGDGLLVKTIGFGAADKEKLEKLAAQVGGKRGEYLYAAAGDGGEELKQCFQYAAESLSHFE